MLKSYKKWIIFAAVFIIGIIVGKILCCAFLCTCGKGDIVCGALNASYGIEGRLIKMEDGVKAEQLSGSSKVMISTHIDRLPAKGDIDGSGEADAAVILTQNSGGEGLYYYVAAAIPGKKAAEGTNAIGLGDRITILGTEIENNIIYVTFLERGSGVSMDMPPNVQVTRMFTLRNGSLTAVG